MNACQVKCPLMSMLKFTLPALALLIAITVASCNPSNEMANEDHGPTVTLTSANFDEVVLKSDKPVLVDFWAPWCGPCVDLAPTISELARDYEGKAIVGKLNTADFGEIATKYNISSIPALVIFKDGQVVDRRVGLQPKENLAKMLDQVAN